MSGFYKRQSRQGQMMDPTMSYTDDLKGWLKKLYEGKMIIDTKDRKCMVYENVFGNPDIVLVEFMDE